MKDTKACLIVGGIIVLCNFLFYFLNKLSYKWNEIEFQKLEVQVEQAIAKKLMNVPFQNLEDPEFLDLKERARMGVQNFGVVYKIIEDFATILQNIFVLISLGTIMMIFDYRLIIIMVITIIFDVIMIALTMKMQIKFFIELIPINRRFGYYLNAIFADKNGKDCRMYKNIGEMIAKQYEKYEIQTIAEFNKLNHKITATDTAQKIAGYIELALIYIIISLRVVEGGLSVATFSLYISAAISFTKAVITMIRGGIDFIRCAQYIMPLNQLLATPEEKDIGKAITFNGKIETIEFKNVTFSYPKSSAIIIDDISFKIDKGEKISIVGLNGAGKTTLVKLICRLYKPSSGEILINGVNINDYEYSSYIKQISAVFQDFKLFAYTLKENILNHDGDDKIAYEIAGEVGLKNKIDSLPKGIKSLYTKSYDDDGIELSGGEQQKVAIARAIYADSSLVILDEPTSALDPLAEADIYANFNSLVKEKTAIYISHRMSSSVFCDRILILDNGKIVGYDTHKNLMKQTDSLYYKLFNAQAKNYAK
jgi:ATP-binding cassette subfamily B protein/ATP-binding cassette subfamily C protein